MKKNISISNIESVKSMLLSADSKDQNLALLFLKNRDKKDVASEQEVNKLLEEIKPPVGTGRSSTLIGYILIINGNEIWCKKQNNIIWKSKGGPKSSFTTHVGYWKWNHDKHTHDDKHIFDKGIKMFGSAKAYTKFLADNGIIQTKAVSLMDNKLVIE